MFKGNVLAEYSAFYIYIPPLHRLYYHVCFLFVKNCDISVLYSTVPRVHIIQMLPGHAGQPVDQPHIRRFSVLHFISWKEPGNVQRDIPPDHLAIPVL